MTGILLLGVVAIWLIAILSIARWVVCRLFSSPGVKLLSFVMLVPVLLLMPLTDELIGAFQFGALCKKYAVQVIDERHAMGRRVVYVPRGPDRYADGTAVRIRIDPIVYKDTETNRVLVSYHTLHANGGWLIRMLGISETNAPLLFNSGCAPKEQDAFKQKFNITVIN